MNWIWRVVFRTLKLLIGLTVVCGLAGAGLFIWGLYTFSPGLPDHKQLASYEPPVATRVHAGDGTLVAEYATERRVFVPIGAMPRTVIQAFISAEDKTFYTHMGIDPMGVARAVLTNVANLGKGRRLVGASTITQQVAKNFLLTNEVSYRRKIREAILAVRIEKALSKERILELYLNQIYLGYGSYGVAAAALNYFDKSLDELTIAEAAYLAALPKAPNNYHPIKRREAAIGRRNWVIGRMLDDGALDPELANEARQEALEVRPRSATVSVEAEYFAEEVRRELVDRYGETALYEGGLSVRTTLDSRLQRIADKTLRDGLQAYDRRHGWRGPLRQVDISGDWMTQLQGVEAPAGTTGWFVGVVLSLTDEAAEVGFSNGTRGRIPMAELAWARPWKENQRVGPLPKVPADVLAPGDMVLVEPVTADSEGNAYPQGSFVLRQVPEVNGALVAIDPHTGRIYAMSGGWSYEASQFNRATQAARQPGSAFKPFVYLAALERGYTPSSIILDAPFVIDQGPGLGKWKPANYTNRFYGPSTMRLGIEKSRNLMTVRLANEIGMDPIIDTAERFGIHDRLDRVLSMSLGAGETTLLRLTAAYAMLVNGGKKITPSLIDRIQDRNGTTVMAHDTRSCAGCNSFWNAADLVPEVPDTRKRLTDPGTAYQVVSMMEGVVRRGTGVRIGRAIKKPLAGKTGTTNDSVDTWFIGFSPDLAVGVFIGFDEPKPLGRNPITGSYETGTSVAVPVFRDFMMDALANLPATPFRVPGGIRLVRVNGKTGLRAQAGEARGVILEAFKPGTEPSSDKREAVVLDDEGFIPAESADQSPGSGLY